MEAKRFKKRATNYKRAATSQYYPRDRDNQNAPACVYFYGIHGEQFNLSLSSGTRSCY